MNSTLILIVGLALCAILIAGLALLYKHGYLPGEAIGKLTETVQALPHDFGNDLVNALRWYCQLAVDAVDQLVKNGTLDKKDDERKERALFIVEQLANVDGRQLGCDEIAVAGTLIESILGQENKEKPQGVATLIPDDEEAPEDLTETYETEE